jgi:hypothetical protein
MTARVNRLSTLITADGDTKGVRHGDYDYDRKSEPIGQGEAVLGSRVVVQARDGGGGT